MSTLLDTERPLDVPSKPNRSDRIPTLDGWRGIAILMVLFDHFQVSLFGYCPIPWLQTGQHGVTIFFVERLSYHVKADRRTHRPQAVLYSASLQAAPGRLGVFGFPVTPRSADDAARDTPIGHSGMRTFL